jgi:uncharacterized membrane protein
MVKDFLLIGSSFAASLVEMVEALTIVLAVGVTKGWKTALAAVGAGLLALFVIVVALGPLLSKLPLPVLRLLIGSLLLIFGLQWLRKAILRASGFKALHDEDQIFADEVAALGEARRDVTIDGEGFVVAFKGVLLEGLEVAFIVVTFGATQHRVGLAALGALAAVVVVVIAGLVVHRPLSGVPENSLKMIVGVMLTSFGIFWAGEGVGAHWPGGDAALLVIIGWVALIAAGSVVVLRSKKPVAA